ncbi:MAG TPA: glycosyltransferase family 2 protein [Bryobacteraceae bacterium]|nr:glycosyltransferase family 2 protein [Bryobacteraceae bacterium]
MAEIGIVIVTYRSEAEIGACLDAVLRSGAEIVVVDNASGPELAEQVRARGVLFIANPDNRGFASAVNQGVDALSCPYILLLNPDAIVERGLELLRAACDLPGSAGAGGCLIGADGHPQVGFMVRALPTPAALILEALLLNRVFRWNPVNRRYRALLLDVSKRSVVEQPAGAFLMFRRKVWEELGGFDAGFHPLWFEDVDFCRRVADRGYLLYFEPGAVARHTGAHSVSKIAVESRPVYWYASLIRYAAKHFRPTAFRAVCLAVLAGAAVRALAGSAAERSVRPLAAYRKVARLACREFIHGRRDEVVFKGPSG